MYRVINDYAAQNDGEIDLRIGQILEEVTFNEDDTSIGHSTLDGKTITFPMDCVVKISQGLPGMDCIVHMKKLLNF